MYLKRFSTSVIAAALLSCTSVMAEAVETHTIAPAYPDTFTLRTTLVQDDVNEKYGVVEKSRLNVITSADIHRSGEGYQALYRIEKFKAQEIGPDGKPVTSTLVAAIASEMMSALGVAKVTLNDKLEPISVDNIEEIKTSLKSFSQAKKGADFLYELLVAPLTPESAAKWARVSNKSASFFDIPLPLGQSVEVMSAPVEIMSASLNSRTLITLQRWEDGKTANLRTVLKPAQEELDGFMVTLIQGFVGQMPQGGDEETRAIIDRMPQSMTMNMTETCDITADLANLGNYRSVCDTTTAISIDLVKLMGLKEAPKGMPPKMTTLENSHKINETIVVR